MANIENSILNSDLCDLSLSATIRLEVEVTSELRYGIFWMH